MPKDGNFVSQRNEFWNWLIKKIISNYHTHKSIAESFLMVFRKSEKKNSFETSYDTSNYWVFSDLHVFCSLE